MSATGQVCALMRQLSAYIKIDFSKVSLMVLPFKSLTHFLSGVPQGSILGPVSLVPRRGLGTRLGSCPLHYLHIRPL